MIHQKRYTVMVVIIFLYLFLPSRMCEAGGEGLSSATMKEGVSAADDPTPPDETVKLIFIHHSCGQNWLEDSDGGLGIALRDNKYRVSDTNNGWGPDGIGDNTDIGHWWSWFRGSSSTTYMNALFVENDQHSSYSRLGTDPGGQNEIIMFKSCYPNSNLRGNPGDPPTTGSNPLRGQDCYTEDHSVANAKGIYNDILQYFATRRDKLFIVVTAPPVQDGTWADNARAFNTWLVQDWLDDAGYTYHNVAIFDFYNVLTSNGGNWYTNDLDWDTGNHHRYRSGSIQYITNQGSNTAAYPNGGDDHPSSAGNQKATAEFVPLLNIFYHRWKSEAEPCSITLTSFNGSGTWCAGQSATITWASEHTSGQVTITYSTNGGSNWQAIATGTPDDGAHPWTVAGTPSGRCFMRICDVEDSGCCDQSGTAFTICSAPLADFGGDPLHAEGEMCQVHFTDRSSGCITGWEWDFGDGGSSHLQNPSHTYGCGESIAVHLTVSGPCGADTETKTEFITCDCPCSLSLLSPVGGEIWCAGESEEIAWTSEHTSGQVKIEYSTDNGAHWLPVAGLAPDDQCPWLVPNTPSTTCLVKVSDVADSTCSSATVNTFQICTCAQLEITTDALPSGVVGCSYDRDIEVVGGCPPYAWSLSSGMLPDGLALDGATGSLSGEANETGLFEWTVMVSDGLGGIQERILTLAIEAFTSAKGDVDSNCRVNVLDVIAIINIILEVIDPTPDQQWCADCNGPPGDCGGDGMINILDALKVVTLILGTDQCP